MLPKESIIGPQWNYLRLKNPLNLDEIEAAQVYAYEVIEND
jgi:hypothetical protein